MTAPHRALIFAGPNGAGKTTFADEFLQEQTDVFVFVNADRIAAMLCPSDPDKAAIQAGRLAIKELEAHVQSRRNFAFETTLSGRSYLHTISRWQTAGYEVELIFLLLTSAEEAIARVKQRAAQGGHGIPEDVIRRRYRAGYANFLNLYSPIVDKWRLYNTSGTVPELLSWGARND